MNRLTGAAIPANNRLFDTLDTTTRLLTVSDTLDVVISDTVGFIRKLPHQLVEAFKATLEELEYADLLLHVIDVSNPEWQQQAAMVESLIRELKADHPPACGYTTSVTWPFPVSVPPGRTPCPSPPRLARAVPELLACIDKKLDKGTRRVTIHLPYDKAGLSGRPVPGGQGGVRGSTAASIDVAAVCTPKVLGQVKDYVEGWREEKEDWDYDALETSRLILRPWCDSDAPRPCTAGPGTRRWAPPPVGRLTPPWKTAGRSSAPCCPGTMFLRCCSRAAGGPIGWWVCFPRRTPMGLCPELPGYWIAHLGGRGLFPRPWRRCYAGSFRRWESSAYGAPIPGK